jgi:hypothetical protein
MPLCVSLQLRVCSAGLQPLLDAATLPTGRVVIEADAVARWLGGEDPLF